MTVDDFLNLICDEEARVKLIVETETEDEHEVTFWLSDYRAGVESCRKYRNFEMSSITFLESSLADKINIALFVNNV